MMKGFSKELFCLFGGLLFSLASGASAEELPECDILVARLVSSGEDDHLVSETVYEWVDRIAGDECGLRVAFYDEAVTEEDLLEVNEQLIENDISGCLIGEFEIVDGKVLLDLRGMQVYLNPGNLVDRAHYSSPGGDFELSLDRIDGALPPPDCIMYVSYMTASLAHYNMASYQPAFEEVNRAIEYAENLTPQRLALVYLLRCQVNELAQVGADSLHADIDRALELNPGFIRARLSKGYLYELSGDPVAAMEQYNIAVELDTTFYKPYHVRANLYSRMQMYQQSLADYCEAVRLNPEDIRSWYYGGDDHYQTGDYVASVEWYTRALELDVDQAVIWNNRALAHIQLDDLESAAQDLNRSLELDQSVAQRFNTLCSIHMINHSWDDCVNVATEGLMRHTESPQLYVTRGSAYMVLEEIDPALEDLTRGIQFAEYSGVQPSDDVYTVQGILEDMTGMEKGSVEYCMSLGYACALCDFLDEAIEQFDRVLAADPGNLEAHYYRGICHDGNGNIEAALEDYRLVLEETTDPSTKSYLRAAIERLEV